MSNTHKCDECGSGGEHKIWCSFAAAQEPLTVTERTWFALTSDGRRLKFTMGVNANAEKALDWAQRHSHILQFERLAYSTQIVSVEAGEESNRSV